jgi:hypothetical protein
MGQISDAADLTLVQSSNATLLPVMHINICEEVLR